MIDSHHHPNPISRLLRLITAVILLSSAAVLAGPPTPDDYPEPATAPTPSSDRHRAIRDDYRALIAELDDVLDEFEEFYQDFGGSSMKTAVMKIEELRGAMKRKYSETAKKEMADKLASVVDALKDAGRALEGRDTRSERKQFRVVESLTDDLEDIQSRLDEDFSDAEALEGIDSESISRSIEQAMRVAEEAMKEAQKNLRKTEVKIEKSGKAISAIPPAPPMVIDPTRKGFTFHAPLIHTYHDSLMQTAVLAVPIRDNLIRLANPLGAVAVSTWNRSEISAVLTVMYSESSGRSREMAREIKLLASAKGNTLNIEVVYPDEDNNALNIVASRLTATIPRTNPVSVENSFGDLTLSELDNRLTATSNFGSIDIRQIKGDVTVMNSTGPVYLENITGRLDASNSFGPIEAVMVIGDMELANSYAPISVERCAGFLTISNSGPVSIGTLKGNANVRSSNGEMEIYQVTGNLNASNSFGALQIENVTGDVTAENSNADLEINAVGGRLRASNKFAGTQVADVKKGAIIESSNGEVSVENVMADLKISNRFGEVTVSNVSGPVQIENSNAAVIVSDIPNAVKVRNQFGPVTLSSITGAVEIDNQNSEIELSDITGAIIVSTTFGSVVGENIDGSFKIFNQNGSVELSAISGITTTSEISTTYGDISLVVAKAAPFNISARSSWGEIETNLPMRITSSGNMSSGEYKSGDANPTIILTGSNGAISIRTK